MDNCLSLSEFCVASFLIYAREKNQQIPQVLPKSIIDTVTKVIKANKREDRDPSKQKDNQSKKAALEINKDV
jgi:hypothetical protein